MKQSLIKSPISSPIGKTIVTPINSFPTKSVVPFSPADIASCRILLDAYDISTWTQDDAGATPVTASGQTIGRLVSGTSHATVFTQATEASRPTYTVSGGERYLAFDGSNDSLSCASFAWGTPRVTVVAAIRKSSDAAAAIVAEFGTSVGLGQWFLAAPGSAAANYSGMSRGTVSAIAVASGFASPTTDQVTFLGRIVTGDLLSQLRVNGSAQATNTATQGTVSDYGTWQLHIGRRTGSTLPFNGRIYRLAVFTENLTGDDLAKAEAWAAEAVA